jgi:hypothetical protein
VDLDLLLFSGKSASPGGRVSISEVATLQLEFWYLAEARACPHSFSLLSFGFSPVNEITGRTAFWHEAKKVMQVVNKAPIPNGLAPIDMKCVCQLNYYYDWVEERS